MCQNRCACAGALIIQTKFQFADANLWNRSRRTHTCSTLSGFPDNQEEAPFDASTLVLFRTRITAEMLMEANEYLLAHKDDSRNDNTPPSSGGSCVADIAKADGNKGTLTLDATCAPVNIRYPQDISLLNEAREKLEAIIYRFCKSYVLPLPRRYRRRARKDYLAYAKSRKHSAEKIRKALRKQLGYVGRDIRYLDEFMSRDMP